MITNDNIREKVQNLLSSVFTPAYRSNFGVYQMGIHVVPEIQAERKAAFQAVKELSLSAPGVLMEMIAGTVNLNGFHVDQHFLNGYHQNYGSPNQQVVPEFLSSVGLLVRDVYAHIDESVWGQLKTIARNFDTHPAGYALEIIPDPVPNIVSVILTNKVSADGYRYQTLLLPQVAPWQPYPGPVQSSKIKNPVSTWAGYPIWEWIPGVLSLGLNKFAIPKTEAITAHVTPQNTKVDVLALEDILEEPAPQNTPTKGRGGRRK